MRQLTGGKRDTIYTPAVLMLVIIVGISFLGLGLVMPLRALYGRQIGASSTEIGLMTASLDGFLADVMPQQIKGKVQANFSAAGLIGNLLGATAAGLLYGFTPGLPFFIGGLTCFAACLVLFLPGLARQFHSAHQKMLDLAQFITPEIAPEEEAIKR